MAAADTANTNANTWENPIPHLHWENVKVLSLPLVSSIAGDIEYFVPGAEKIVHRRWKAHMHKRVEVEDTRCLDRQYRQRRYQAEFGKTVIYCRFELKEAKGTVFTYDESVDFRNVFDAGHHIRIYLEIPNDAAFEMEQTLLVADRGYITQSSAWSEETAPIVSGKLTRIDKNELLWELEVVAEIGESDPVVYKQKDISEYGIMRSRYDARKTIRRLFQP